MCKSVKWVYFGEGMTVSV